MENAQFIKEGDDLSPECVCACVLVANSVLSYAPCSELSCAVGPHSRQRVGGPNRHSSAGPAW